jgi:ABC-2 type transport system ATP-binding protein
MPGNVPSAVSASGLVIRYGSFTAIAGVDLQAAAGEVVALLGRNGAGKTSTVEALEGYRKVAEGTIQVLGLDPQRRDHRRRLRSQVGVMLQHGGLYPAMAPREALKLFASYYEHPEDPLDLMERLGLVTVARTPWRRLSGGEQQRLSMALALIGRPQVAFLDEPTAGVDPHGRIAIREEVLNLKQRGACVVLTTHELAEAERMADRIVIIEGGTVVACGTAAELAGPAEPTSFRFKAPPGLDVDGLADALGAAVREQEPGNYWVDARPEPPTLAALTGWLAQRNIAITGLDVGRRSLEEVFLRLTGGRP